MRTLIRTIACLALLATTSGCWYTIKLDPMDPNADVYVNGEIKGRGQVDYTVGGQYGPPDSFGVKVSPAQGAPYVVSIKRQFDTTRAVVQTLVSVGLAAAFLVTDYNTGINPATDLIFLAYAPLGILNSFYYNEYYDLPKLRDSAPIGSALNFDCPPLRLALRAEPAINPAPPLPVLGYATMPNVMADFKPLNAF